MTSFSVSIRPRRPVRQLVAIAAALVTLSFPLPLTAKKKKADLSKWISGPVRYIASKPEAEDFKTLETDTARAYFIEKFWRRRDPNPGTLTNARRQMFWERVQQANQNFVDSSKQGWMTDRGKIFILYGPPAEIFDDPNMKTEGLVDASVGLIRWTYQGRPTGKGDMSPIIIIPFVRDLTGEYHVSYDPELSSVFFNPLNQGDPTHPEVDKLLDRIVPTRSDLSVMLDLGRMQEIPTQEQVLIERVETLEAYATDPVVAEIHQFLAPDSALPTTVVTLDLSDNAPGGKPTIVARFVPLDATRPTRILGEDSFAVQLTDAGRRAQGRIDLAPGKYVLTLLVADPIAVRTGFHRMEFAVRAPSDRLRFSDIVWADRLESLRYATLSSYDEPFLIGPFHVVPRLSNRFSPGDAVGLFYEVYDAELPLRISYQVEGQEVDGSWVKLGRPATGEQDARSQAWELPTSLNWPLGEYRIVVEVIDAAERMISTSLPFSLEAPTPSPAEDPEVHE